MCRPPIHICVSYRGSADQLLNFKKEGTIEGERARNERKKERNVARRKSENANGVHNFGK